MDDGLVYKVQDSSLLYCPLHKLHNWVSFVVKSLKVHPNVKSGDGLYAFIMV